MSNKDDAGHIVAAILMESENQRQAQEKIYDAERKAESLKKEKEEAAKKAASQQKKLQSALSAADDDYDDLLQDHRELYQNFLSWKQHAEKLESKLLEEKSNHYYRKVMLYSSRTLLVQLAPLLNVPKDIMMSISCLEAENYYFKEKLLSPELVQNENINIFFLDPKNLKSGNSEIFNDKATFNKLDRRFYETIRKEKRNLATYLTSQTDRNEILQGLMANYDERLLNNEGCQLIIQEIDTELKKEHEAREEAKRRAEEAARIKKEHEDKLKRWKEEESSYREKLRMRKEGELFPEQLFKEIEERTEFYAWVNHVKDFFSSEVKIYFDPVVNYGSFFKPNKKQKMNIDFIRKTNFSNNYLSIKPRLFIDGKLKDMSFEKINNGEKWSMQPEHTECNFPINTIIEYIQFDITYKKGNDYFHFLIDYIPKSQIVIGKQ